MKAICILCLTAALACAQATLSLNQAVEEATGKHPDVASAEARVAVARAARVQATLLPNPRLFLQTENTRFWGSPAFSFPNDTDNFLYLSQVLERGDKRERRTESADALIRRAEADRDVTRRRIAAQVSSAYWAAAAAQMVARLIAQDAAAFDTLVQYHRDRVREGAMAEVDLLRILLERDRLTIAVRNAEQDARRAGIELQRAMGRREFVPLTLTDIPPTPPDAQEPEARAAFQARVDMAAARQAIEEARSRLRLEEANSKQDPEALFGYKRTSGYDTLIAGLQINLPLRNRNQGRIAGAVAEIRLAEQELRSMESRIAADIALAWSDTDSKRRLLTDVLVPMRDRAQEIARIAQAAYREGGTDLLRLIDAERSRLEAVTTYYRALADYQQALTNLQIVTGGPL
ncbi:MAG TPA: TolC family protein [Bryobacteraceae bacterium]|nr:TolC family protein [Bryobacteraceae bacterium]